MAKFLIGTIPLMGHVSPAIAIAQKLIEHGHEVGWYTGQAFQKTVEGSGAIYFPMHHALDYSIAAQAAQELAAQRASLKGLRLLKFDLKTFFVESALGQFQDLYEILDDFPADVIVGDSFFLGAAWTSEKLGIPWAQFSVSVLAMNSIDTAPFGLGLQPNSSRWGHFRNRVLNRLAHELIFKDILTHMNRLRESVGLLPTDESFQNTVSPYLYLLGSIESFEYPRSDLPSQVYCVGPFLSEGNEFTPPAWWDEILNSTQPIVLVTQGTVATNLDNLVLPTIRALANEEMLVIATTGGGSLEGLERNTLPSHVRVESFIPFQHLLPHVDLMVTNGGFNGVMLALANGVPLVAAGKSEDKAEISARIEYAGVGINLKTDTPSPKLIQRAVQEGLTNPDFRLKAQSLQGEIQQTDAAFEAMKRLEALVSSGDKDA